MAPKATRHLGFEITYVFDGVVRKYLPDFLLRLDNGKTLILETKGQETQREKEKRKALAEWVSAVNGMREYGEWCNDISYNVADVDGIIQKYIGVRSLNPSAAARLYIEKYDPQSQQLFLDFIDEKEFLYYKMRGDVEPALSLEEGTPTILCFSAISYNDNDTIEGMIIEIPFSDLWNLPHQETLLDSDILAARYEENAEKVILNALDGLRTVKSNEYVRIPTKWSGEPTTLGKTNPLCKTIVYNVGEGSWSEVIDTDMNYTIFDCGTSINASKKERVDLLHKNGNLIKASSVATSLLISHWDSDHYNLLRSVDNATLGKLQSVHFPDRCITMTSQDIAKRLCHYCKKTEAIKPPAQKKRRVCLHLLYQGGSYQMYIGSNSSSSNVSAITLQVHGKENAVILTADQRCKHVFEYMLPPVSMYTINIVIPHHGGNSGKLPTMPPNLIPEVAAVSTDGHSYGHPYSKVLNYFSSLGFKVIRTDRSNSPIILSF